MRTFSFILISSRSKSKAALRRTTPNIKINNFIQLLQLLCQIPTPYFSKVFFLKKYTKLFFLRFLILQFRHFVCLRVEIYRKEQAQFLIQMDPDNHRTQQQYNPNMRMPDRSIPQSYGPLPPMPNNMLPFNYMYSAMQPLYYPSYPYQNYQYPSSPYLTGGNHQWRDNPYPPSGMSVNPNYPRSVGMTQNPRVTPRDLRDKQQHEVINLESDQQSKPVEISPLPPLNNSKKQNEKPINFIEIEDNSPQIQKIQTPPPPPPKPRSPPKQIRKTFQQKELQKLDKVEKLNKADRTKKFERFDKTQRIEKIEKIEKEREQSKVKQVKTSKIETESQKTKQIRKANKKVLFEGSKEEKSSREKKRTQQPIKNKTKESQKQIERANQKKADRNQKNVQQPQKKKQQDSTTREIAKYMESHGEIRHGKQFQSNIPSMHCLFSKQNRAWIEQKKRNLLLREVGPRTY